MLQPCIFLMGPTASGKTDLALFLSEQLPCELISVDSALVYRGMDIGTAKPSADILTRFPHHLVDIRDPSEAYSAAQFCSDAHALIQKIHAAGRIPLFVGGTGLYFRSLQQGLSDLPSANPEVRAELAAEAAALGWEKMHQKLAKIDPIAAQRIHPNDPQRIQRALEVHAISGMNMTEWFAQSQANAWQYPTIKIIISPAEREVLHSRIATRFHAMLEQGFIEEVQALYARADLNLSLPSMRAVGYRQVYLYLAGELPFSQVAEQGIIATRQLAKRQLTWLRAEKEAEWFDSQHIDLAANVLKYLVHDPILSATLALNPTESSHTANNNLKNRNTENHHE